MIQASRDNTLNENTAVTPMSDIDKTENVCTGLEKRVIPFKIHPDYQSHF